MLTYRLQCARILSLRPLRPPARYIEAKSRSFTQHTPLLLLTRDVLRPQLPYLSQTTLPRLSPLDQQVLRLLSTETRRTVKDVAWKTFKWGSITWTVIFLLNIMAWGLTLEIIERGDPTPPEWSFWTRQAMRRAKLEIDIWDRQGFINWVAVGNLYTKVLTRLEDANIDGRGVVVREDAEGGEIVISTIGTIGRDVSLKSSSWRQGYFEALMGMAQASEMLEQMVRDATRNLIFPKSTMIGPSNPDPRPVRKDMESPPLEENCERPVPPPEKYYMQILTGNGFTTKQKLNAALAYANWLEYTGLNDSAEEVLKWGVDIARAPLENGTVDTGTVETGSFVLTPQAMPSENLLKALTAVGVHRARMGDAAGALPILLSVFRARQNAELSHEADNAEGNIAAGGHTSHTDIGTILQKLRRVFTQTPFPNTPDTGDATFTKQPRTPSTTCDDSELMLYIGEILFANSAKQMEGLNMTKQSVEISEQHTRDPTPTSTLPRDIQAESRKCLQCLKAGLVNLETMLAQLASMPEEANTSQGLLSMFASRKPMPILPDSEQIMTDMARVAELRSFVSQQEMASDLLSIRQSIKFAVFSGADTIW